MAAERVVLAIDLGSTRCKAAFFDRAGMIAGQAEAWVRDERLFGHDEAALDRLWQGVVQTVREAHRHAGQPHPEAVAVTARKAPGIWLDGAGRAIGLPAEVIANAGRDEIDACYLSPLWGADDPFAYGYGLDLIGNTRWLWRNHPEQWARLRRIGNIHCWLLYRLTGKWATSHAGGPVQPAWPEVVRTLTGLPPELFPTVFPDSAVLGQLHPRAATELGLPPSTPVVTGTHDGAAANIGSGALEPGDACLTFGTNGVLRVVTGDRLPGQFGYTVTTGRWALVRDLPDLALLLDEVVAAITGAEGPVSPDMHSTLTAGASAVPAGSHGLRLKLFPDSEGLTVGAALDRQFAPSVIYRAALEAVALGFAGLVQRARAASAPPTRYVATGGAADNDLLLRITTACLDAPLELPAGEAGLLGVATLAAPGAGWFADLFEAQRTMQAAHRTIVADAPERVAYAGIVATSVLPSGSAPGDSAEREGRPDDHGKAS